MRKAAIFWPVVVGIVVVDVVTKRIAEAMLQPRGLPRNVFESTEWLRLTLVYNPGAAFGLHLGQHSRWIFMALTIAALFILGRLYRQTRDGDPARALAIALVCAGAIGNLIDRVVSPLGVVDFVDIGIGDMRWPTFNVADMAVSTGAFLLAWVLWGDESAEPAAEAPRVADGRS